MSLLSTLFNQPVVMTVAIGIVVPLIVLKLLNPEKKPNLINEMHAKERKEDGSLETSKVVDVMDIEDLEEKCQDGKKCVMCRCWKSKKVFLLFVFSST